MAMKPMKALISLGEGMRILMDAVTPIARNECVELVRATGRVLAEPITAPLDVPPFARAAMDGYAALAQDTFGAGNFSPAVLRLLEAVHAGELPTATVTAGSCVQVATGSPIPPGADAVIQVEDTEFEGEQAEARVKVYSPVYPGQNISTRGKDLKAGQVVLSPGVRLDPSKVGVLAALGLTQVTVYARPAVAVVPSGNELVPPGEPLPPGKVYDINSYTLSGLIGEYGGNATIFPIMQDSLDAVRQSLGRAVATHDLVVLSGGSSVGDRDVMVEAVEGLGELLFHGIAVKPGKPTLCGVVQGKLVLGMPGYPTSCLTNGYGLLVPVLRKLGRLPQTQAGGIEHPMSRRYTSTTGRHQFLPVRIEQGEVVPVFKDSGAITSMADAEGYIEIPANVDLVEKGERVLVRFF